MNLNKSLGRAVVLINLAFIVSGCIALEPPEVATVKPDNPVKSVSKEDALRIKEDKAQLIKYQLICEKAISKKIDDHACKQYIYLAAYFPYESEEKKIREKYLEYISPKKAKKRKINQKRIRDKKRYSPPNISKISTNKLCLKFRDVVNSKGSPGNVLLDKNIYKELKKRGFKTKDINKARKGVVSIGAPVCMLYATWGKPDQENRTVNKYVTRIQHVYPGSSKYKKNYFYSSNGKITSWQD